jgi:hypothetical protein
VPPLFRRGDLASRTTSFQRHSYISFCNVYAKLLICSFSTQNTNHIHRALTLAAKFSISSILISFSGIWWWWIFELDELSFDNISGFED